MPRYTDVDALLNELPDDLPYKASVKRVLMQAPAADVVPKSEGKWKPYKDYFTHRQIGWICTSCSAVTHDLSNGDTNYCPHCGAVMETESEEEDE